MSEQETSYIEIEEEQKNPEEIKTPMLKKLTDLQGWKKDGKKIGYAVLVLLVLIGLVMAGVKIKNAPSWGIRWHAPIERVKYQTFNDTNAKFSFAYPERYVFDADQQKKFGNDYLAGFHLKADGRTGCDIRKSEVGINFAKSDQEIATAVSQELATGVKGFDKFSGQRLKLNGQDAYKTSFSLTDPLGNSLHITQVLVSANQENYLLVCGSGEAQYEFFAQDFADFLQSFRLN